MTGPGGDEVARVSVKVAPNTDDFKRDLERQLRSLRDEDVKIPVQFDLDKDDLDRQLNELRLDEVKIPVSFDVENVRDDVQRATRGVRADPIELPIEPDRDYLEKALAGVGRDVGPIEVPLDVNDTAFSAELKRALDAGEIVARNPILFKLEADAAEFERKIASTEDLIDRLRNEGVDILFRARQDELDTAIDRSRARLEDLTSRPWTAELQVKIDAEQDRIAQLLGDLGRLDRTTFESEVQLRINAAMADLANYSAELNRIDGRRVKTIAEMDVDTLKADARIAAFVAAQRNRRPIELDIDIDRDRLGLVTSGIADAFASIVPNIGRALSGAFSSFFTGGAQFINDFRSNLAPLKGALMEVAQVALSIAGILLKVSAVGTGLALAGAAVTVAWGAVATAVSTLPGLFGLVGAAAGTVALGLDGIKKAAGTIKPEFDKLRESVAATFEKGMTPAFKQLATIFPQLQGHINGVAQAISISATNMAVLLTSSQGVSALSGIFDKTKAALLGMQIGLQDVTLTFLQLASQKSVFDLLTAAVNDFGAAFKAAVASSIASGDFDAAMRGLSATLKELSLAFTGLVKGGLTIFANAAPGLNAMIASLREFFGKFDWERLGTAAGDTFRGIADAIKQIPPSTIEEITRGFEEFGKAVNGAEFKAGFQAVIGLIKDFVAYLPQMVSAISRAAVAFSGFVDVIMAGASLAGPAFDLMLGIVQGRGDLIGQALLDLGKKGAEAAPLMAEGMGKIAQAASDAGPGITAGVESAVAGVGPAVSNGLKTVSASAVPAMMELKAKIASGAVDAASAIPAGFKGVGSATATALAPVPTNAATAMGSVNTAVSGELAKVPPAANQALAPIQQLEALQGMRDQFTLAAADSMHAMSVGVQSGMAEVQQQFKTGMDTASSGLSGSFTLMEQGVTMGMSGLAQQVTLGMTGIQTSFSTGFAGIATNIGTSIAPIRGNIGIAMAGLTQEVTNGMIQVTLAFQTGFTGIATGIGTSIAPIRANIAIAMGGISQEVANGMIQVTLAFQTGFAAIAVGVGTAIAPIRMNLGIAMVGLAQEVTNGMLGVQQAFTTGFTLAMTNVNNAMATVILAVNTGMIQVQTAITTGINQAAMAFATGGATMSAAMTAVMAQVALAATAGMTGVSNAVTTGMAAATAALVAGMAGMGAAASAGMAQVTAAINAGMAQAVAAVEAAGARIGAAGTASMAAFGAAIASGMSQATAAVAAATAQMIVQFTQLGQQIVVTATTSMASFGNAVRSGMAAAQAAVASGVAAMVGTLRAGAGQFHSVGVQMMNGLRAGILSQAGSIAAAAAAVVRGAVAAARAEAQVRSPSRAFLEIGSYMGEGLALGMERSVPRVEQAADRMAAAAVNSADRIGAAFSGSELSGNLSTQVAHSFGELSGSSNQAMLGQQRIANGELSQSTVLLAAIVTELRALRAAAAKGGSVVGDTASSRRLAELGAF